MSGFIINAQPPGTSIATASPNIIASPSSDNVPILQFDDGTPETYDLLCAIESYNGGDLIFSIPWCTFSTPDDVSNWEIGIRRLESGEDLAASHTYAPVAKTLPQGSGTRQVNYTDWTLTSSQIDGLQNEERFILRIKRTDTAGSGQSDDIEIIWPSIVIKEVGSGIPGDPFLMTVGDPGAFRGYSGSGTVTGDLSPRLFQGVNVDYIVAFNNDVALSGFGPSGQTQVGTTTIIRHRYNDAQFVADLVWNGTEYRETGVTGLYDFLGTVIGQDINVTLEALD